MLQRGWDQKSGRVRIERLGHCVWGDDPIGGGNADARYLFDDYGERGHFGFRLEPDDLFNSPYPSYSRYDLLVIPLWFLLILFIVYPVVFVCRRFIFRRRREIARCATCGYDLRVQLALSEQSESNGSVTPTRCPECGAEALVRRSKFDVERSKFIARHAKG